MAEYEILSWVMNAMLVIVLVELLRIETRIARLEERINFISKIVNEKTGGEK